MLERVPGAYIQIGNGDGEGACEVHNPGYDFNDAALPLGASLFARLVERRLARLGRDGRRRRRLPEIPCGVRYLRLAAWAVFLLDLVAAAAAALQSADPAATIPKRRLRCAGC